MTACLLYSLAKEVNILEYNVKLFNAISDAVELLEKAQQEAEEAYLSAPQLFLFRSLESSIFGVISAGTHEEAVQLLSHELGESVELLLVTENPTMWVVKDPVHR